MPYVIKFPGTKGNPESFLTETNGKLYIGAKIYAKEFPDNEEAIDAALSVMKDIAMFGLTTKPFTVEYIKKEEVSPETDKKK